MGKVPTLNRIKQISMGGFGKGKIKLTIFFLSLATRIMAYIPTIALTVSFTYSSCPTTKEKKVKLQSKDFYQGQILGCVISVVT